mmetsp:Transcript_20631/g.64970  ORF Transcript_20631/g.64970 Transcript_20631/m.64970 type:complete len:204 (+) Transcript_20631:290-901(+)
MIAMSSWTRLTASASCFACCRSRAWSSEMKDAWLRMMAVCSPSCFCSATSNRVCSSMSRCTFCASSSGRCWARPSSNSLLMTTRGGWSRFRCAHSPTVEVSVMLGNTLMDNFSPSLRSVSTTLPNTCRVAAEMASFTEASGESENLQLLPWCMKTARHSMDLGLARVSAGELERTWECFTIGVPMVMDASPPFSELDVAGVGA